MGDIFNILFIQPILNVLLAFYQGLSFLHMPYALGFSIILLTVFIRIVLYPFTRQQLKASKKMQDLSPHISRIREKHKGDSMKQQRETMNLYKQHGVNPAAGCLPTIIQLPIIWALYTVLQQVVAANAATVMQQVNKAVYFPWLQLQKHWDTSFFGLPLGQNPSQLIQTVGVLILLVPIITGVSQFIQSKMMFSQPKQLEKKAGEKKEEKKDDFMTAFQSQSLYIFPAMIGFFSYTFPIGLSLYWNTFTLFGILQQYQISGWGGMEGWIRKIRPQQIPEKKKK